MTPKLALLLTWTALVAGIVSFAVAQQSAPSEIQGCIVVSAAPAYTAQQRVAFTCNLAGQLRMSTTP
jgi:hypothetical protein